MAKIMTRRVRRFASAIIVMAILLALIAHARAGAASNTWIKRIACGSIGPG